VFLAVTYLTAAILRTNSSNNTNLIALFLSSLVTLALHTFWHAGFYIFSFRTFFSIHHSSLDPANSRSWLVALTDFFPFGLLCFRRPSSEREANRHLGMWLLMAEQALGNLIVLLGFLFLVFPGIYALFGLSFALPLLLHHSSKGLVAAMAHSFKQQNKHLLHMILFHILCYGMLFMAIVIPSVMYGNNIWDEYFAASFTGGGDASDASTDAPAVPINTPFMPAGMFSGMWSWNTNAETAASDVAKEPTDPSTLYEELGASQLGRYSLGFVFVYYLVSAVVRPLYYAVMTACYSDVFGIEFSELLNPSAATLRDINASFEEDVEDGDIRHVSRD
jgi:hypothetical protein